jgi:UDP-N-acetylmuramate dehydrogenase
MFDTKSLNPILSKNLSGNISHFRNRDITAYLFLPDNISDLANLILKLQQNGDPFLPLGGGSNFLLGQVEDTFLISDKALPRKLEICNREVIVSANFNINSLNHALLRYELGGLSFLSGIPAHIGGLIKMNAGAHGRAFGEFVNWIKVIDNNGKFQLLKKADLALGYRQSNICGFVYEISLQLNQVDPIEEKELILARIAQRKKNQPLTYPNLGCFFKNPPGASAGRLIDQAGLKGKKIGDACVSNKHANFIINLGNATFGDTLKLIELIKSTVYNKFKINLENEIEVLGK